jgi:hypothetical protein
MALLYTTQEMTERYISLMDHCKCCFSLVYLMQLLFDRSIKVTCCSWMLAVSIMATLVT